MRFYPGIEPMAWLARTPSVLVDTCLRMLPRLEAEEAIARVNETAVASGNANAEQATLLRDGWSAAARDVGAVMTGAESTPRPRPDPMVALGQHGIPVRRIPKRRIG